MTITQAIEGNLTDNHRYFPATDTKKAMLEFIIVSNTRYRNQQGEWVDGDTDYIPVRFYGKLADSYENLWKDTKLAKGMAVIAVGRFDPRPRVWMGKDNQPHAKNVFNADRITTDILLMTSREEIKQTTTPPAPVDANGQWVDDGFIDPEDMPFL
ncbi:single-stranded DNA-binding protein [Alloscardovia criceti]|uniref:single-stranded DNA-binding protein n=1 Tax=Alloscardovia criceti TaxID=356828 RepID=UPI001FE2286E|nr:single-stranded DNA-binding protein [Alloscardovia criceti]